jgi:hypothetical protein
VNTFRQTVRTPRQGTLLPAMAVAILVVGCCLALVLDKLWLDAARGELQTAAEAAALAAAGRLADDERLNLSVEPQVLTNAALDAAGLAASRNTVAGRAVTLNTEPGGDIRFGQFVMDADNGESRFEENEHLPTVVRVRTGRTRQLGNPVARLFAGLTGLAGGDAIGDAEATLSNLIVGVRPFEGGPAPVLPFAIFERDPEGERNDTWAVQIEGGGGSDEWTFDHATNQVRAGQDGLSEIKLHPMPSGGKAEDANLQVLNIGNGLDEEQIVRQVETGWNVGDLADYGGEFRLDLGSEPIECSALIYDPTVEALRGMIGQKRLVLLYENYSPRSGDLGRLTPTRFVAVRIMAIEHSADGTPQVIAQPTVVATRTALPPSEALSPEEAEGLANAYVYKISLTH